MKSNRTSRERIKPDFSKMGAIWVDDGYITGALEAVLRNELRPRKWSQDQTNEFLRLLAGRVQLADEFKEVQGQAGKKKALQAVEMAAHRLLLALEALSGTEALEELEVHVQYLARVNGGHPPFTLSGHGTRIAHFDSPIGGWWDVVNDIERAAGYAADEVVTSQGMRVKQQYTRKLVWAAASAVRGATGNLPSASKGTWFPEFARVLCEGFNALPCGVELVAEVVKEMRRTG